MAHRRTTMRRQHVRGGAAEYYGGVLAEQARSGLSLPRFAAVRGLNVNTLRRWRGALRRRPAPAMVPVTVVDDDAAPAGTDGFEVRLRGGEVVFVPADFDAAGLTRLLGALAR
jgi:hypothetical protein